MKKTEIKKIIKIIADKTICNIQFNGSPCGTCFMNMKGVNYSWLSWILLLALRGDYSYKDIEKVLKDCLNVEEELTKEFLEKNKK